MCVYRPSMQWEYQDGDLFTLVLYDVGNAFLHGVYVNIQDNDIATSQVY